MPANNPSNSSKHSEQRAAGARPVAALLTVVALALALLPAASSDGLAHAQGAPTATPLPDLILDGRSSTLSGDLRFGQVILRNRARLEIRAY